MCGARLADYMILWCSRTIGDSSHTARMRQGPHRSR